MALAPFLAVIAAMAAAQPPSPPCAECVSIRVTADDARALAANTIGGRAGDESKWRTMADEVRQAQASFARLGPVPGDAGRELGERFHKACNRFFDQYRRKVPPPQQAQRGRPVGTR